MATNSVVLILVSFVYGLAFFSLGLAIALESRRSTALALASSLNYLAAFALLHAVVEWLEMLYMIQNLSGDTTGGLALRSVKPLLVAVSALCLLQFAVKLTTANLRAHYWLGWVPMALFFVWLVSFVVPHVEWLSPDMPLQSAGRCLACHRGQSLTYLALSGEWVNSAEIWARYLMYLPGSLLAAVAMLSQKPYFRAAAATRLVRYSNWAAAAFVVNALFAGVIVAPGNFFPASVVNYASFFAIIPIPPQVFRAGAAIAIAYFVVGISSIFEIQQRWQLEQAQKERIEAQQAAQAQLERWNRELEAKVEQRTGEVEQRNRQLAILEERDRLARELHDSLGQILGYLGLRLIEIDRELVNGQIDQARATLGQVADAVHESAADVRESILSLKTSVAANGGLLQALEEYLVKFGEQASLRTEMVRQDKISLGLAPLAEVQLLRIVQEALANVRKHAQAKRALVRIEASNGDTSIIVEDDGRGFDLAGVADLEGHHFGLQAMRERAEEIGATIDIQTVVGQGTKVIVKLPHST